MSKPVKPWRESKDLSGAEARAAELFQRALPPGEASPAVQQRQLAVLRGDVLAPRRFRLSVPATVAIFFGASMAFAATSSNARQWVREKLEEAGVIVRAPKAPVHPEPALSLSNEPGAQREVALEPERVMEMEALDVSDGGPRAAVSIAPIRKVPPNRPTVATGSTNRGGTGAAPPVVPVEPPATDKAAASAPPAAADTQAAAQKPAVGGGVLNSGDLPTEMSGLSAVQQIEVLLKHGDLDEAQELLNREKEDHSDRMNLLRGELLLERGMYKQANIFFSSVVQTRGVGAALLERALFGRVKCLQAQGENPAKDLERYRAQFPHGRL